MLAMQTQKSLLYHVRQVNFFYSFLAIIFVHIKICKWHKLLSADGSKQRTLRRPEPFTCKNHRHFIHRLRLPANAAGKICAVVILGLPTVAQVGSAVGKPIHKPKIDVYDPFSLFISNLMRLLTARDDSFKFAY